MPAPALRPPPVTQMGAALARLKREDVPFESAWRDAKKLIIWPHDTGHRQQWRIALEATRAEWQACYEGRPTPISLLLRDLGPAITLIADSERLDSLAA